ncbi:hypothetical protein FD733_19285 (plasmid) [Pantoea sp. Eser]|nr:hypothetical protein [Pantoea sp. Eser]
MNGINKIVDELEAFKQSIRHLPLAEQKVLIKKEYKSRMKAIKQTRKIILAGAVGLVPALVWSGICLYNNAVLENFRSLIGLFMLSPAVMLATEFTLKKILR